MADNITLNAGSGGSVVAADDVSSVFYQRVKLDLGGDGATLPIVDQAVPTVLVPTGLKIVRVSVTPTISTGIYAAKDAVGGLMTFSNAARASGGSIVIEAATIIDNDQEMTGLELVLFDRTFSAAADNAIFAPSDADLLNVVGVVKFSDWADFSTNSIATRSGLGLAAKLNGTDLFGQLLTRGTPTFTATSDITVVLHIVQN